MIAEAQSKQASLYMVNVQKDGSTDDGALSLNIDGVRAALDTCAMHSVVTSATEAQQLVWIIAR